MEQDASTPQSARPPRKRRWRVALVVILLGMVGAGWWWFTRPREMLLVSIVTPPPVGHVVTIQPFDEGYAMMCRERVTRHSTSGTAITVSSHFNAVAFYRWNNEMLWKVDFPAPKPPPGSDLSKYDNRGVSLSLSPNGRHVAATVVDGDFQQITHWQDGSRVGAVRLPCRVTMARLRVADAGRIYAWIPFMPNGSIYIIEGGRVVASGTVAIPPSVGSNFIGNFSLDSKAFVLAGRSGFTYYRVSQSGSTLKLTSVYTAREPVDYPLEPEPLIMDSNLLLAKSGAIYDDCGRVSRADGWQLVSRAPGTYPAVLQSHEVRKLSYDIRIINPRTRRHWSPGDGSLYAAGECTPDGRYALIGKETGRRFLPLARKLADNTVTPAFLKTPLQRFIDRRYVDLVVYERPGRARAKLRTSSLEIDDVPFPCIPHGGTDYSFTRIAISRDGHTVRFICVPMRGEIDWKIFTYAW
jgi:hypothetical protein